MKQFLKFMFASTIGTVLGLMLITMMFGFVLAGIVGSAIMMADGADKMIKVEEGTLLKINLESPIVERSKENPFAGIKFEGFDGGQEALDLKSALEAIERAKTDDNIKGIYLTGKYFLGGISTMQSLRDAITDFKSSGKFVYAYEEIYSQGAYYVASASDEIYLFHEGMLEFKGLRTELAYFKNAMDKLDIQATVIKGPNNKFKSAVEPFYREDMSDENREQLSKILNVVWDEMTADISSDRGVERIELDRIANEMAIKKPEDAVSLNLIDALKYYDEVLADLRTKLAIDSAADIKTISLQKYAKSNSGKTDEKLDRNLDAKENIAVIYAVGGIDSGEGNEEEIGSETLSKAIREARLDENVKAIVLRVNSPGGSAMASDVIWRETVLAGQAKPFIVSFGDVAASGGYYISAAADKIFAMPTTITGSIGAFGLIPNPRGFLNNKLGITFDNVKTHDHADFGSLARDFDAMEIELLQGYLDDVYNEFVAKVAEGRQMTFEQVDTNGRGRVWIGADAKEIGLVDEIGDLNDAIAYAAELAELENYEIMELPKKKDPFESFIKEMSSNVKITIAEWALGEEQVKHIKMLDQIQQMDDFQARMLFEIKIR